MRLGGQRRSLNIEDRRGGRGGGFRLGGGGGGFPIRMRGMSLTTLALLVIIALVFKINPLDLLVGPGVLSPPQQAGRMGAPEDEAGGFVSAVLGSTEDVWGKLYTEGKGPGGGGAYAAPTLTLFSGSVQSACGGATSAVGPFYCPADSKVYLDTGFFQDLSDRFGAPGDFAQAYVIAHEVGHHLQNLSGVTDQAARARQALSGKQYNAFQVKMELQADCYAGVWGYHAQTWKNQLEPGDVDEALAAANAIGDDRLQRQAQGRVVPDSFTHGTSEQRARWFKRGFDSGDPARCDTFNAPSL